MQIFPTLDGQLVVYDLPGGSVDRTKGNLEFIFAHGWGNDHRALLPLAESFITLGHVKLFDFAGFGAAKPPASAWGTDTYAKAVACCLKNSSKPNMRIWVAHSFGCRVGLRLAAQFPELLDALVLIAPAGLKRHRSFWQKVKMWTKQKSFKLSKKLAFSQALRERLANRVGSEDYRNTQGVMRQVFVKTVNEDLTDVARQIKIPTLLICGAKDSATPPEISIRLNRLIEDSQYQELPACDHHNILTTGRHQVSHQIRKFLEQIGS